MSRIKEPFACDGENCGQRKGATNRWWMVSTATGGGSLTVSGWSKSLEDHPEIEHFCSEACVSKALSRWMAKQS